VVLKPASLEVPGGQADNPRLFIRRVGEAFRGILHGSRFNPARGFDHTKCMRRFRSKIN
jgi:hypothetical protein